MFSVFFHLNKCKIYFDIELKSASSSGTKSPKPFEMHALIKQTNLLCEHQQLRRVWALSPGHSVLTHTSDPLLCAHKLERRCV